MWLSFVDGIEIDRIDYLQSWWDFFQTTNGQKGLGENENIRIGDRKKGNLKSLNNMKIRTDP